MKIIRITIGAVLTLLGVIFAWFPGSILVLLAGLLMLSFDIPIARHWLRKSQNIMALAAKKLDRILLARRLKRN